MNPITWTPWSLAVVILSYPVGTLVDVEASGTVLAKVRALLAKAESTEFPAEADALTAKAQELMARHRIDAAAVTAAGQAGSRPGSRRIVLDPPYASAKVQVLVAAASANHCQVVVEQGTGVAHVFGFPDDLDAVELLHTSLLLQAARAMLAEGPQRDARGRARTRSFRHSFLVAFGDRVGERLRTATADAEAGAARDGRAGVLPVLHRRDDAVAAAVATAYPRLAPRRVSLGNREGLRAGVAAADRADVGAPSLQGKRRLAGGRPR